MEEKTSVNSHVQSVASTIDVTFNWDQAAGV